MKKTILIYGILLAGLTGLLRFIEYRYLIRDLSVEVYVGIIAIFFTGLGVWVGLKLTRKKESIAISVPSASATPPDRDETLQLHGISKRELEVLELMAQGHSNQEIADELFVSLNTVKTHSSNLFSKLDVRRRTQAVQRAKELGILPPAFPIN